MGVCASSTHDQREGTTLNILSYEYNSEEGELYDFKLKQTCIPRIKIRNLENDSLVLKKGDEFSLRDLRGASEDDIDSALMVISKKNEDFLIRKTLEEDVQPHIFNTDQTGFWVHIGEMDDLGSGGAVIEKGDMFALGKKIFFIRSLNLSTGEEDIYDMIDESKGVNGEDNLENVSLKICRICQVGESDPVKNPLLTPCDCTGSMQFIHLSCLRMTFEDNKFMRQKSLFTISYDLKALFCEICLAPIPETMEFEGKLYSVIDESKINPPYVLFEVSNSDRTKLNSIHCLKLNFNSNITIGSSQISDIMIDDSNVSSMHAKFMIKSNGFFISDNSSRFGTFKFYPKFKIHSKFNNLKLSMGRLMLQIDANCPAPSQIEDLPKKSNLNVRFSKLKNVIKLDSEDYENILYIDASEEEADDNSDKSFGNSK